MDIDVTSVLFYVLAVITSACAVAMVVTQNIVRAAAWLLFALAGTAGIFFLLTANFVGATQLLVYVGGTLVLVVFGVMLTAQGPFITMKISAAEWAIALTVGLLLYGTLAVSLFTVKVPGPKPSSVKAAASVVAFPAQGNALTATGMVLKADSMKDPARKDSLPDSVVLGKAFLGSRDATPRKQLTGIPPKARQRPRTPVGYLLPFEIVSVHLLVVLIGAAYLARAKRRRRLSQQPTGPSLDLDAGARTPDSSTPGATHA